MIRYIDLISAMSKNCKRCSKCRARKDRSAYEDAVFYDVRSLVNLAVDECHQSIIPEALKDEVDLLQKRLSLACHDCVREGAIAIILEDYITSAREYLNKKAEEIEKRKKAQTITSEGKLIFLPGCDEAQ